jgi:hypothetical protein
MRRFGGLFTAFLLCVLSGLTGCESPSNPGGQPEPEPEGPRAGLYAFSGDYVPGETETTAEPVPVLPFSPENAFAVIRDAETPRSYLILVDKDFSFLATVSLPEGVAVALKGLGSERVIQFYNDATSGATSGGGLLSLSGGRTLILDENITLLGSKANGNPLITVGKDSRMVCYGGASIQEHGGSAVRVDSGGIFALEGGSIASCGVGVTVATGGVFIMHSGNIAGNDGIGVVVGGSFTLHDGGVAGNGTGVSVYGGTFVMKDGSIAGNSSGGGVDNRWMGTVVIEGGLVSGNHNTLAGGGVRGNFSISGGSITGNTSADPNPGFNNINAAPVVSGDSFVIEGYREVTDLAITLRDINGSVKTGVTRGRAYACSALVLGVGDPPQEVSWSMTGNSSSATSIDPLTGALAVGYDETAETLFVTAVSTANPKVSLAMELGVERLLSLKTKLGVTTPGNSIAVVTEVFSALHDYIAAGHLSDANEKDIGIGDYVDLYRLKVSDTVAAGYNRGTIDLMNAAVPNDSATLRLVVAAVNAYKGLDGNGDAVAEDHLVVQFQHSVATRRGNDSETGATGYAESELRKYLSPVPGFENSGCFFAGLKAAGIPEAVFYSPRRTVSSGTGTEIIQDPVWPTAGDLSGFTARYYSSGTALAPAFCVR